LLRKLAVRTVVFHLWKQRNNLIHNQILIPPASVFYGIDKELRNLLIRPRFGQGSLNKILDMNSTKMGELGGLKGDTQGCGKTL
ncbi:hypothetical protein F2Q70_00036406, partial [Brassica cretica]